MVEEERWVMHGLNADDPNCIKSVEQLQAFIEEIGFLPLFRNEIPGFSVEEHTAADSWWSEDPESDPWEWRKIIAGNGRIAYGKFFDKKAGFISRGWLPAFANYRRDGYDFDARWDDELASIRSKKIMNRAAGTIGTYHTKAMRKLRWKSISAWYLEGYEISIRRYFAGKGWTYRERVADKDKSISGTDYCLRLGISLKQFDALVAAGIETVFDLIVASGTDDWYKPIKGIGPKTAQDLLDKLDRLFINGLEHAGGNDD